MASLLTLSIGEYSVVELILRLTTSLIGMTALLLLLSVSCSSKQFRFPLILSSVALLGAAWFESGVWLAWKDAFELAGTSYCVTGHLLAGQDRIIAWSLGVPAVLFCFGMIRFPHGNTAGYYLEKISLLFAGLAIIAPFSSLLAIILLMAVSGAIAGMRPFRISEHNAPMALETRIAVGCVLLSTAITFLGSWNLLPLGKSANGILVRGEIILSLCDLLSLAVPSVILLIGVLKLSNQATAKKD
jgi:hypothetical protein